MLPFSQDLVIQGLTINPTLSCRWGFLKDTESTHMPLSGGSGIALSLIETCSNQEAEATAPSTNVTFGLCSHRVADKLPRPNLVLLKLLLSLLHHISQNAETNRMDSSNLAICIGPNMLSPGTDSALPLEVQKEMNDKVRWTHRAAAPSGQLRATHRDPSHCHGSS